MGLRPVTSIDIQKEVKSAHKDIKQANKNGQFPVKINKIWELVPEDKFFILRIQYLDCDCRYQVYNVLM